MTPETRIELPFKIQTGVRKKYWRHLAPSLNVILTMHFRTRMLIKDLIAKQMMVRYPRHSRVTYEKPIVHFFRMAPGTELDNDNLNASFKFLGDELVNCGYYKDDSLNILSTENFKPHSVRVKSWKEAKIVITIKES